MRYLGIDYGDKRIGLALSDPEGKIAMPLNTMSGVKDVKTAIAAIVQKEGIKMVIVGLPVPFSGKESPQTLKVKKFADKLKRVMSVPLDFQNEVLTTRLAKRSGIAKERLDASSAAIILQDYLDKQR